MVVTSLRSVTLSLAFHKKIPVLKVLCYSSVLPTWVLGTVVVREPMVPCYGTVGFGKDGMMIGRPSRLRWRRARV